MSRWSASRQLPRNFLVTSWRHARHARLPRNICYGEVTGKLVPVEFELYPAAKKLFDSDIRCFRPNVDRNCASNDAEWFQSMTLFDSISTTQRVDFASMTPLLAAMVACGVVTSLAAPADVTCIHGNVTYSAGQQFKADACTTCRCGRYSGGRPDCVVEECTASAATVSRLNCRRIVKKDDECCASCEQPGCLYNGRFYAAGAVSVASAKEVCFTRRLSVCLSLSLGMCVCWQLHVKLLIRFPW